MCTKKEDKERAAQEAEYAAAQAAARQREQSLHARADQLKRCRKKRR